MSGILDHDIIHDVIIVGAGLYGIFAAKTYLEIHPKSNILLIEEDSSLGGVWSSERIYESFWTQTVVGMAEFSDRPLPHPPNEEIYHGFFPAKYVTKYLEEYVDSHVYASQSLRDRMTFNFSVDSIKKSGKIWSIRSDQRDITLAASKLIIATGLTSTPNMPKFPNRDVFRGPVIHQKEFGQSLFLSSRDVTNVIVIGGGKSAADIIYASAKAGKNVSWIIREGGCGPAAHAPANGNVLYKNANDMLYNRLSSSFSPSVFISSNWLKRFLHQSQFGRRITMWIWDRMDLQYRKTADYQRGDPGKTGFHHLEPDTPKTRLGIMLSEQSLFWQNDSTGVNQKPDFWDIIATKVHVYRQDIVSLEDHSIHLKDGSIIASDILVCATGWRPSLSFFDAAQAAEFGLPSLPSDLHPTEAVKWEALDKEADHRILQQFPQLSNPPPHAEPNVTRSPFRLYKMIAPLNDDSIAFLGHIIVGNNFRAAECQGLWAVAYLDGKLSLPSTAEKEKEISLTATWCKRRYPYQGVSGNWLYYDLIPYTDKLLEQIGLSSHRRSNWFKDFFAPCNASDLRHLQKEYLKSIS